MTGVIPFIGRPEHRRRMDVIEREVSYYSEGDRIAGTLYLPAEHQAPLPGVVLCHGFTGIKELILPDYGHGFAAAGFAALAFDYRGFGASEGTPGRLVARRQIEDIRNSLTCLGSLSEVDPSRLALWGTSYGAANVIVAAAADSRARCVVAQVGFADGGKRWREAPAAETTPFLAMIEAERRKRVLTNESTMVEPLQLLSDPETVAFFGEARTRLPGLSRPIAMEFLESTMEHRPIEAVTKLSNCPVLLVAAEHDRLTPAADSKALFDAAPEPRRLVVLPGIRHYEIYSGAPLQRSIEEAANWFREHLTPA